MFRRYLSPSVVLAAALAASVFPVREARAQSAQTPQPSPGTQPPQSTPAPQSTQNPKSSLIPEIHFTVHQLQETNVEGPDVERTYFMAGSKKMIIGVPKECRLNTGDSFILLPKEPDGFDGEIRVVRSTFTPDFDLVENVLKYRASAEGDTPKGATNVEVKEPVMSPYPFNGWKSLGFIWTYNLYGRPMIRTVNFINLEIGAQIVVTTVASKNDAPKVDKLAKQFMSSWWVKEK